ncbi:aspartate 1-decarboxylase [Pseudomonas protegens]|uniref:aspartate 1-decarboxylase n=1 Tax=Pseudomonas protegens TaxID=380021 RepID=UPI003807385C
MYTIMFKAKVGDRATLCTYAPCSEAELLGFKPRMLHMAPGPYQPCDCGSGRLTLPPISTH